MSEFFLELFSEEIPARMQAGAAEELQRRCLHALQLLNPTNGKCWSGPRRIAFAAEVAESTAIGVADLVERAGPRIGAPAEIVEKFKAGFIRDHGGIDALIEKNGKHIAQIRLAAKTAAETVLTELPRVLADFPWPKSMRWGQSEKFTWIRPLRHIVCLLDAAVVPLRLGPVTASNESEGHRFLAPGAFKVSSVGQWKSELVVRRVVVDAAERRAAIEAGLNEAAAEKELSVAKDAGLLDEVSGLVEWPVCLLGAIEPRQMALPPEVRELSMKVNQRYFATRDADGKPAPFFAFVANIEADDGGAAIIAGNERVLRARLADAEHFWNEDRKHKLDYYLPKLAGVTFHAKLGTQLERANRIVELCNIVTNALGASAAEHATAQMAARLCKADLVTGMVGEFPELQGIMGGYYADDPEVGAAIRTHYQPKGPSDAVPEGKMACAVALADKLDTLRCFFSIGEKPTGSGDPYALRRAALGVIRIIVENRLRLELAPLLQNRELFDFVIDRLRVKLRSEGQRFDIFNAVVSIMPGSDLTGLIMLTEALEHLVATEDGTNLLAAYRRGVNILRIEDAKDGPHVGSVDHELFAEPAEIALAGALERSAMLIDYALKVEDFTGAMIGLANLREPVDAFFNDVTVNADDPQLRRNRLRLLARLRDVMHRVADFSKLEG
ncbi:MAG: glycine--tRNA ligase subunit beta [Acidiphilium sp.]